MDYEKIGNFLYELRKSRGLTQQNLANRFYITREAISKWERGISLPDYPSLIALSKFYNLTINEILAGEKLDEHNKDRIEAVALTILQDSEKKIKKSRSINVIVILIAIIVILATYFVINYNSVHMYTLGGNNDEFYIENGQLFIYHDKAYLNLGLIHKSDGSALTNNDGYRLVIYYDKDNKKTFYSSNDVENVYISLYTYKDIIDKVSLDEVLDNLHIDLIKDSKISTIDLNRDLFYENNIKSNFSNDTENYSFKAFDKDEESIENEFYVNGKKYSYIVENNDIEVIDEEGIIYNYSNDGSFIMIKGSNGLINYSFEMSTCITDNCDEYMPVINYIKDTLIDELGLS